MAAPIAGEDRPDVCALTVVSEQELRLQHKGRAAAAAALLLLGEAEEDGGQCGLHPGGTGVYRSTEELVDAFNETLSACFQHDDAKTDSTASVSVMSEEMLLDRDQIWKTLTSNYGQVMPVEWKRSRTRTLHIPTFNLEKKPSTTDVTAELSDDEELREQLDMHSIIVSCLAEEPLFTAEQVIEEIEEMMQDSLNMEAGNDPSQSDLSTVALDVQRPSSSPSYKDWVGSRSIAELNERLEEMETNIRRLSEELVQQLALRDELDFEKEVKNSFISALIDVQNRQKEQRELLKKKKKLKGGAGTSQGHAEKTLGSRFSMEGLSSVIQNSFRQKFGSACSERQYLSTVIPYEKTGHPPSNEELQILTKILHAMRDDSDKVPSLLTDYILKVLCPT